MSRFISMITALMLCPALWAAPPPIGTSKCVLAPTRFGGWCMNNACYPFVIPEGGGYRMFYAGSGTEQWNDSVWDQWMSGSVTSTDTIAWKRPDNYEQTFFARKCMVGDVLNPAEIAEQFDSVYATGLCVIKEDSLYKAWYTGWNGQFEHVGGGKSNKINFRIGYATSPDGLTWSKFQGSAGGGAVLGLGQAGQQDAKGVAHPHVLKIGSEYRMWYEGYDGTTWRLFHATSPDGTNWTRQGVVLDPGTSTGSLDRLGLRNPMVLFRKNQWELWYQGQSSTSPNYHIRRATSSNPAGPWTKVSSEVTLSPVNPTTGALSRPNGSESILVDSYLPLANDQVQLFYAKQISETSNLTYGTITRRRFYIYTEVVNP